MKVLVLAAGYGTRLYSIVKDTPKALLPINNKPLLNYTIDKIKGIKDLSEIVVVTNNKFEGIFKSWAKGLNIKKQVTILNDGTNTPDDRLGSIGDIKFSLDNHKIDEDLLIVGGDNLFDFDIAKYIDFAKIKQKICIGVYDIHNLEEAKLFGVVAVDSQSLVTSFEEKPDQPKSTLIAMCFYYLPRNTLSLLPQYLRESGKADKAGDYIKWLHKKTEVYGFEFTGKWFDIGSVESYHEAQENFK
ncbi:MAG: nucleotidyltransferase family protein [Candidatus Omnitrophica bacterium]|nr:nucleotidyltransferase family protein [Candidatus Omnitrophota bacterium]